MGLDRGIGTSRTFEIKVTMNDEPMKRGLLTPPLANQSKIFIFSFYLSELKVKKIV